ncbi:MAG: adenylosuccinate synthase [Nitrospirae bacterium]|nr:MAG: adenylosuccinate synthase [Nitrospirota bacterium]
MATLIVVGSQWGDEGKGKIVDLLAQEAQIVVRFQGGSNAGHTVITKRGTYVFHLVPSGILYRGKLCMLGNGVVIDPAGLIQELDHLIERGVKIGRNLIISPRAHLIMPYHKALDAVSEEAKGSRRIGTTGRGIGPAYADKMARVGIRIGDLLQPDVFRQKVEENLVAMNRHLHHVYQADRFSAEKICHEYLGYADRLRPYVADVSALLDRAIAQGRHILFEGAQGTHLDIDFGTYPYVTSSNATAGGACTGTGVGPTKIDGVIGVTKAYTTRVGEGPFPTELTDEMGEALKTRGQEFGATTGRQRRCGWLDSVLLRYAVRVNGLTSLAVTKLDVLDGQSELKICTGYRHRGKLYKEMPADLTVLRECTPVYERLPGWSMPTTGITGYKQLPMQAKRYLARIEELAACPISMISTGSRREDVIVLHHPLTGGRMRSLKRHSA